MVFFSIYDKASLSANGSVAHSVGLVILRVGTDGPDAAWVPGYDWYLGSFRDDLLGRGGETDRQVRVVQDGGF
jgi:hypothetical protein